MPVRYQIDPIPLFTFVTHLQQTLINKQLNIVLLCNYNVIEGVFVCISSPV